MQVRYGWTDETIHELPFARFMQLVRLSVDARNEKAKDEFILAAFLGHQLGAGGQKDFPTYLKELGLSNEAPSQPKAVTDGELASIGIMREKR